MAKLIGPEVHNSGRRYVDVPPAEKDDVLREQIEFLIAHRDCEIQKCGLCWRRALVEKVLLYPFSWRPKLG